MKSAQFLRIIFSGLIALSISAPASAAISLYDKENTTFSVDGSFNTFYAYSDDDTTGQSQSRIKMGFLPNWIGFNFSKQVGDLKLGGRSSFWVTINDSDDSPVDSGIDVRQFFGTVDGRWGQVLFGKDFTLFNRSNIFRDEILQGFGKTGGIDSTGVSFGNIGTGYSYPLPSAQITYRTPEMNGFKLAVGLIDPSRTSGTGGDESSPRIEGELTYKKSFERGEAGAWVGFLNQSSENGASGDVDSRGISYGINGKYIGLSLTASGFTGEGINTALGAFGTPTNGEDSSGYLLQGSYTFDKFHVAGSYGKTEIDNAASDEDETVVGAVFYSVNDYLKLAAEYNIETITSSGTDREIKTLALGGILNF